MKSPRRMRTRKAWTAAVLRPLADRSGSMGLTIAMAALPLTGLALGAVEFSRITSVRAQLQDALDAAVLTVARSPGGSEAEIDALGSSVLVRMLAQNGRNHDFATADFNVGSGSVTGSAMLRVKPIIAQMVLGHEVSISASSEATLLGDRLEVALVLDSSHTMMGSYPSGSTTLVPNDRLPQLKLAATNFVDTLSAAAAETQVGNALRVSVVPFNTTVNTGMALNTGWVTSNLDVNAQSSIHDDIFFDSSHNRFTLLQRMAIGWNGCVEARPMPYDANDAVPTAAAPDTLYVPYFAPDEPDAWEGNASENSYLPDHDPTADWRRVLSDGSRYTMQSFSHDGGGLPYNEVAGPDYECANLQPLMRLTDNLGLVKGRINALTAVGSTNIGIGLAWAWNTLAPSGVFGDGSAYGSGPQKIVIVFTDGNNTLRKIGGTGTNSSYSGTGFLVNGLNRLGITDGDANARTAALDRRMNALCSNMKSRDITIYTVRIASDSSAAIRNCASSAEHYFNITEARELDSTFNKIAQSIVNPRLVR